MFKGMEGLETTMCSASDQASGMLFNHRTCKALDMGVFSARIDVVISPNTHKHVKCSLGLIIWNHVAAKRHLSEQRDATGWNPNAELTPPRESQDMYSSQQRSHRLK